MAAQEAQEAPQGQGQEHQACQVCGEAAAKYTCPRCERRTCSLQCVKAHKEATGCSGKRDRTAFVGRAEFDERTFMSDYRFLEEVQLADDVAKRSKPPAPKLELPQFLQTLQYQAGRRGVQLHILPPGMEKRRTNSTRYDGRLRTLHWHVEWAFPAADGARAADHKVHENTVMADLLRAHLALQPGAAAKHHALREHAEAGLEGLTVLLRRERTPANAVEFYEIDVSRPLRTQLAGKVVVEFPTFLVLLPRERGEYAILPQQPQQQGQGQGQQQQQGEQQGEQQQQHEQQPPEEQQHEQTASRQDVQQQGQPEQAAEDGGAAEAEQQPADAAAAPPPSIGASAGSDAAAPAATGQEEAVIPQQGLAANVAANRTALQIAEIAAAAARDIRQLAGGGSAAEPEAAQS